MAPFVNSIPGDTQDAKAVGVRRTPPTGKRKASEMLGGSPGSEDRAASPEPSEGEAKKKNKTKMNFRHYRSQNKDAMTQLRDALLPEHMRPPERSESLCGPERSCMSGALVTVTLGRARTRAREDSYDQVLC
jgi:hypothetical protein